ncbi:RNA polymerase sigma-70 factor, ECF subfamily [Sporobacter termitidis DSM 10068]|uniref:RNA polymerase sigma-70 factor, ECF subfamily n=1 Tax=Sporobacter termitidis DSM 10068 TaxID=1123282 RepID=A0A1M5YY05_9FIRM|nr:RNA polymerase sigma factor [Sporobacter termitidis]SHI16734.1 RNA polymerase sigma-70 factor, ECF subfamily [Sporobacter termitidis DSM 10068]
MTDFNQIYNQYFIDVYKYALSLSRNEAVAEEITQETFFKALKSLGKFDGKCKLYVWLCQIAKNTYYTFFNKENRLATDAEGVDTFYADGLEQGFLIRESAFEVHKALHKLTEPYKEVFSLRFFGELPFSQIAELFGKTESWARVTYHRARLKIKEELA